MKPKGGKRPGAGRKPSRITTICKKLPHNTAAMILSEISELGKWRELLDDDDPRIRLDTLRYLTDRRDGKPVQNVKMDAEVNVTDPGERRSRIAELVAGIARAGK